MEVYNALILENKQNTRIAGPNTRENQGIPRLVFWANQRRPAEYQGYQAISEYQGIPNTWYTQTLVRRGGGESAIELTRSRLLSGSVAPA